MKEETRFVHAGQKHDEMTGAVIMPVHMSTIFAQKEPGRHKGFEYARVCNPTR